DLAIWERPAEGSLAELPDEVRATGRRGRAGNQLVRIASGKRSPRQSLRRAAVSFGQQRRDALPLSLVGVAIHEVFRRKAIRRPGLISQQIVHRVIVLA